MTRLERKQNFFKKMAVFVAVNMIIEIVAPTVSMALTSGPSSPEFASFEPVATNNMVDPFSGDFTYNLPILMIPGTNGGGYPLSLSYHSGTTSEQESSWVGHGWTLNPGAINRGKQGFPDDWNGETVINHNKSVPVHTITAGITNVQEFFSIDGISLGTGVKYNNYKGLGYYVNGGFSLAKGFVSLGFNISDGQTAFSLRVDPWKLLQRSEKQEEKISKEFDDRIDKVEKYSEKYYKLINEEYNTLQNNRAKSDGIYGFVSLSGGQKPNQINDYTGFAVNFSTGAMVAPTPLQAGIEQGLKGSYAFQKNKKITENHVFGDYYTSEAYADEKSMMDYYTEKDHPYENNDIFLGIPHALNDQYMVTGEGTRGAFRMHKNGIGQYRPNRVNSEIIIGNLGFEAGFGANNDMGFDIGVGYHNYRQEGWDLYAGRAEYSSGAENKTFRFTNDLGGYVEFDDDTEAEAAELHKYNGIPGFKKFRPDLNTIDQEMNQDENGVGRSSFIGHNTFSSRNAQVNSVYYNAYEKNPDLADHVHYGEDNLAHQIAEMSVTSANGEIYNYGLPVFARNERDISIGLKGIDATIKNNYLAYTDADIENKADRKRFKVIQGQERPAPYVTSYLLTSICAPNYIDRTNNGPTEDDFGGYTKFGYDQVYGSGGDRNKENQGNWYEWRYPYTGLYYNKGKLSDQKDDMGSYNYGEKEVYYLNVIETKTHIAIFHTSPREDGLSAETDQTNVAKYETSKGSKKLKKLDKIELFVKDEAWETYVTEEYNAAFKPAALKTVNFEYDYSLVPGIPNSNTAEGKLTLTKVWFDYEGVYKAKISPYEFEYNYPDYSSYPQKYRLGSPDDVTEGYINFNGANQEAENPAYNEQQLNAWGYNQGTEIGKFAHDRMRSWQNQTLKNGESIPAPGGGTIPYDPAAWNLKVIKLPSGGEIHVQYEQDDYQYVQDKLAHVMVPLKDPSSDVGNDPRYYLDTDSIGVSPAEYQELADAIQKLYINKRRKIYFKMLYSMTEPNSSVSLSDCDIEYIKGYINVHDVGVDGDGVYIDLHADPSDDRFDLPRKVCKEYVKAHLRGKTLNDNCLIDDEPLDLSDGTPGEKIQKFMEFIGDHAVSSPSAQCATLSWENSYLRVPSIHAKKGGGVRVKRLLMYTPALHTGEESELYGTEYLYQFRDTDGNIKSSGVAVNEPAVIREENILVDNIDRLPKNDWDKLRDIIVAGKEKEKFEGPIGESLYGAASVGYSQVITRNIHSGKTNTGFSVQQFYTAKDFPLIVEYTDLAANTKKDYLPIPAIWINNLTNNVWAAQGYHFTVNSMHGRIRSTAMFTGDYSGVLDPLNGNLVSATQYEYFNVDEPFPVMNSIEEIEYVSLGKETEMYMESRSIKDHLHDVSAEFDVSVGFATIPIPFGSLFPSYTHTETELHTHVTNKITRYPAMVKSMRSYIDGVWSKTENLAFNPKNGNPVITRTYDDFNDSDEANQFEIDNNPHYGWLTSYEIPAWQAYTAMDQIAVNQGETIGSASGGIGYVINKTVEPGKTYLDFQDDIGPTAICDVIKEISTGDLIQLSTGPGDIYHIVAINGNRVQIEPTYYASTISSSEANITFRVIRSGRTNQTDVKAGTFVTYGKQVNAVHPALPGVTTISFNDPTHPDYSTYLAQKSFLGDLNAALNSGTSTSLLIPSDLIANPSHPERCLTDVSLTIFVEGDQVILTLLDCSSSLFVDREGAFEIDLETGVIHYGGLAGECGITPIKCLQFCNPLQPVKTVDNVLTANAITLADQWEYDASNYDNGIANYNAFELGKRGKWRLESTNSYKSATTGLNDRFNPFTSSTIDENFSYNSGTFTMELFNWETPALNDPLKWLKTATITNYSPDGNALEEVNILGIRSTVKFGYHENVPYLVAGNSPYQTVLFESFENTYTNGSLIELEDHIERAPGTVVTNEFEHTGYHSLKFASGNRNIFFVSNAIPFTSQIQTKGLHTKLWIKNLEEGTEQVKVSISDAVSGGSITKTLMKVAQTGEWTLYELNQTDWTGFNPALFKLSYFIDNSSPGKYFYVDDLRIQPMDAEMMCYVYDYRNYRLLATLDDQHFAQM